MAGENKKYIRVGTAVYGNVDEFKKAINILKDVEENLRSIDDSLFDIIWNTAIEFERGNIKIIEDEEE